MQATSGYGRISESAGWPLGDQLGDGRKFGWIPVEKPPDVGKFEASDLKNGQNTVPFWQFRNDRSHVQIL